MAVPTKKDAANYLGNTHGGMAELNGDWYIFYHRQTNQHSYSRQACAEKLKRKPDGGFFQAEVTSCGLNGEPLKGVGEYPARIACNLWSKHGVSRYDQKFNKKLHPYFTQDKKDGDHSAIQYIANMQDGSVAGFKYFDIKHIDSIRVCFGGKCDGYLEVSNEPTFTRLCATIPARNYGLFANETAVMHIESGVRPLYFRYVGRGALNFYSFELQSSMQT